MRWAAAISVWLVCSALGALIGIGLFFADDPSGANGLLGAMFVAPMYGIIGALFGVLPAAVVFLRLGRTADQRDRNT